MDRDSSYWRSETPDRRSVFERTLDALPDGVLLIGEDRRIEYANKAFGALWRLPPGMLAKWDDRQLMQFVLDQLADPDQFVRAVERLYGSRESSQDELLFRDGRVFSRRSVPLHERFGARAASPCGKLQ